MEDWLKDLGFAKVLYFVAPGALISLFRSFAIRGSFPALSKDDLSVALIGSAVYAASLNIFGANPKDFNELLGFNRFYLFVIFVVLPIILGLILGLFEASDWIGRLVRKLGIHLSSPYETAWETLFQELQSSSVLVATLKDGAVVYGRWTSGSASSSDAAKKDLFIAEIGTLNEGAYVPKAPKRGIYISEAEIRWIEVVQI